MIYVFGLIIVLFWPQVSGYSAPVLDCSRNQNTVWCNKLLRRGNTFFCTTKGPMTMKVCRKLWCENCPQELQKEIETLKKTSLDKMANEDIRWKEGKTKFKDEFKIFGLENQLEPAVVTPEQTPRYETFLNTIDEMEEIKKEVGEPIEFEMDINKFAFMTKEEKAGHAGMKTPETLPAKPLPDAPTAAKLNQGTDWRPVLESVRDIMDQGFCGCCWAISAAHAIESAYEILSSGTRVKFSPQDLVDCSTNGINKGCDGGLAHFGMEYIRDHGLAQSNAYPYASTQKKTGKNECRHSNTTVKTFIDSFDYFYSGDVNVNQKFDSTESDKRLMQILDFMPVAGAIASNRIFQYSGGIYNNKKCLGPLNHAILIVGYGTSKKGTPYWIIKNSWGTSWGEQGFIRVKRGNYCGVGQYWAYPKKLNLCPKFTKPDCDVHPDCSWYGDSCDVKAENCGGNKNKLSCEFFGCYWHGESNQCMPPTSKCVLDANVQVSQEKCTQSPHCEWVKYGNCQVKASTCSAFTSTFCLTHYCNKNGDKNCVAWTAYQCSTLFTTKESCDSKAHCQWYGNKCLSSEKYCSNNQVNGEFYCNNAFCQWTTTVQCAPPPARCVMNNVNHDGKASCLANGICSWDETYGICNILSETCSTIANSASCALSQCKWTGTTCTQPSIQSEGVCSTYKTDQQCQTDGQCMWYGTSCGTNQAKCLTLQKENDCKNHGCTWFGQWCRPKLSLCSSVPIESCSAAGSEACFKSSRLQDKSKKWCDPFIAGKCVYDIGVYNSNNVRLDCEHYLFCQWDGKICKPKDMVCNAMKTESDCSAIACKWSNGACQTLQAYPCEKIVTKEYCVAIEFGCEWQSDKCTVKS